MHIFFIVLTVFFDQSSYRVNENRGLVVLALILSSPSSTDITVQVNDNSITAMG